MLNYFLNDVNLEHDVKYRTVHTVVPDSTKTHLSKMDGYSSNFSPQTHKERMLRNETNTILHQNFEASVLRLSSVYLAAIFI